MGTYSKSLALATLCVCCLVFAASPCLADELIGPTRTLEGAKELTGKLVVLSEPPGLDVSMDGAHVGDTPLLIKEVEPGVHKLRIKDSETDIVMEPGKTRQITLFKGSFINILQKEKGPQKRPEAVEPKVTEAKKAVEPAKKEKKEDLSPFEKYISGALPFF